MKPLLLLVYKIPSVVFVVVSSEGESFVGVAGSVEGAEGEGCADVLVGELFGTETGWLVVCRVPSQ